MKLYVFETDKWIESDMVYPHDIAVCLHPERKILYVWEGPRATPVMKKDAQEGLEVVKHKFQNYAVEQLNETAPQDVNSFIKQYINTSFEEVEKIDRDPQYVAFFYTLLGLFAGLVFGYIMILRNVGWKRVPGMNLVQISETAFSAWSQQNYVILIVLASIFTAALVFAGLTKKIFLIATALVGMVVLTGTILYFRLGIYLFDFYPGAPTGYFYIAEKDVTLFFFLNISALLIILIPMVISVFAILKTTTPITWKQWIEKNKKSAIEMKKFSILDMASDFTEIEERSKESSSE